MTAVEPVDTTQAAAELLADAWAPALETSHRIGWENGYKAGYLAGKRDEAEGWQRALGLCTATLKASPRYAELQAERAKPIDEPCPQRCQRCSRCIRVLAVRARLRAGQPADYQGGPVTW